jgi:hypothetical protein
MLSVVLVFVPGRLRMPALAILFLFAGYALAAVADALQEGIQSKRFRSFFYSLATVLILWLGIGLALRTPQDTMLIRWNDYFNLGSACEIKEDYEGALHAYENAQERAPGAASLQTICDDMRKRIDRHNPALKSGT